MERDLEVRKWKPKRKKNKRERRVETRRWGVCPCRWRCRASDGGRRRPNSPASARRSSACEPSPFLERERCETNEGFVFPLFFSRLEGRKRRPKVIYRSISILSITCRGWESVEDSCIYRGPCARAIFWVPRFPHLTLAFHYFRFDPSYVRLRMGPARDESDETIFEPDPSFERVVSGPDPVLDPGFRYDF